MKSAATDAENAHIEISTIARLTGLTTANIRMWEKRYNVVQPSRTESQRRLYTEADLRRLTLLKTLVDMGDPIRSLAPLSDEELENRIHSTTISPTTAPPQQNSTGNCRLAVVGYQIVAMLENDKLANTEVVADFDDLDEAERTLSNLSADLLIIECPALFEDTAQRVRRLITKTNAIRAIVIYHFAQHRALDLMDDSLSLITKIRGPINHSELHLACAADIAMANRKSSPVLDNLPAIRKFSDEIPARKFNDKQLALISQATPTVECECPNHLANLVTNLQSFETYSAECESRNEADAKMHAYLHRSTAQARALIEDALKALVEFEGINTDINHKLNKT